MREDREDIRRNHYDDEDTITFEVPTSDRTSDRRRGTHAAESSRRQSRMERRS